METDIKSSVDRAMLIQTYYCRPPSTSVQASEVSLQRIVASKVAAFDSEQLEPVRSHLKGCL
jgi:hypothetical protein